MWYQKYRDENKEVEKSRIFRELYYLMMGFAMLSVVVKAIWDPGNWKASLFELLLIIFSAVYYILRSVLKGLYEDEERDPDYIQSVSRKNMLIGGSIGLMLAILFGSLSGHFFGAEGTTFKSFIFSFLGALILYIPFFIGITFLGDLLLRKMNERKGIIQEGELEWEEDKDE